MREVNILCQQYSLYPGMQPHLICHLGGGVSHLATERGPQGIQITAVNSLAMMGSSSTDCWYVVRSWFWIPLLYETVRRITQAADSDTVTCTIVIFMHKRGDRASAIKPWLLALIWFPHKEGHWIMVMPVTRIWQTIRCMRRILKLNHLHILLLCAVTLTHIHTYFKQSC